MRWKYVLLFALWFVPALASASPPQISLSEARTIALARVPGTIVHEKLKSKKKHSYYNIKIAPTSHGKAGYVEKVTIDAETGKITKIKRVRDKRKDTAPAKNAKGGGGAGDASDGDDGD